jgi:hypothetical protein
VILFSGQIRNLHALRLEFERAGKDMERRHQSEIQALKLSLKEQGDVQTETFEARVIQLEATIKDRDQELGHQKYISNFN